MKRARTSPYSQGPGLATSILVHTRASPRKGHCGRVTTAVTRPPPAGFAHISKALMAQCVPGGGGGHQSLVHVAKEPGSGPGAGWPQGRGREAPRRPSWPSLTQRPRSCNLTCPPGLHGVDCAQPCNCHEDSCDPVTGACRLGECGGGRVPLGGSGWGEPASALTRAPPPTETNQRKGVMGAGALLALLLGLLLSLLGCCCACRGKDPARR